MSVARPSATGTDDWIDLADRAGDGLKVELLWSRSTGSVKLNVTNVRSGRRAERDVPPADALTAFYHPFAYYAAGPRAVVRTAAETTLAA